MLIVIFVFKGAAEKHNDHMAARLGKSVQNCHRIVGFLYIAELAHLISAQYLEKYDRFPSHGAINSEYVGRVQDLYAQHILQYEEHDFKHFITLDIVERCRDIMTGNIEQYKLLMYLSPEERFSGVKSTTTTAAYVQQQEQIGNLSKKEKRIQRLQPRMAEVMSRILLFRSITFNSTSLYADRIIKRSASILASVLKKLIELELITVVKKGLFSSKWTPVYVKLLPDPFSVDDQMIFECKLGEIGIPDLNLESYRESCQELILDGKGIISDQLIEVLQRSEYSTMNFDLKSFRQKASK